jgi:DNA-binding CsgD family transcriptional regulator
MQLAGDPEIAAPAPRLMGRRREREALDGLLRALATGESRALVLRGEAGVGKTALLEYLLEQASGLKIARATGVQSEMELAYAGLHQLCSPLLDRLDRLPDPQRDALRIALGIAPGSPPDRFLVALATLSLLAEAAEERPLVCVVDDEQWLDSATGQILAFVARRLQAESVGLVFATRAPSGALSALGELVVEGLRESDARALLDSVLSLPVDPSVRELIVSETHGNPLALLELAGRLTPEELAGGFAFSRAVPMSVSIERSFQRRLEALPHDTRRLLRLAATDPVGDPALLWKAAEELGIPPAAAAAASDAGLMEIGPRVRFRHPLVRSAAYRSASAEERRAVHAALAHATDAAVDPDRRAWYLAEASPGPDEHVAEELEHSADRARDRGGLAAAAAFLERGALLTPEPAHRAQRLLAAAAAKRDAGAPEATLGLLTAIDAGALDELGRARMELLGGQVALEQRRGADAGRLLLGAAKRLEHLDPGLARETYLEVLGPAMVHDLELPDGILNAAKAARAAPPAPDPPRAVDVMLDAFAVRLTDGYAAAAPAMDRALGLLLGLNPGRDEVRRWLFLASGRASALLAVELWDAASFRALMSRQAQFTRETGALMQLKFALGLLARSHVLAGELATAALRIDEERVLGEVTGSPPFGNAEMTLAAWRGKETPASELIEARSQEAAAHRWTVNAYASAVLHNGLGRHDLARDMAWGAFKDDPIGSGPFLVPELAESASRTGEKALLDKALEWLSERTSAVPSEWARGIEARIRALRSDGEPAEDYYRESIERLAHTPVRVELARSHLLYGEWLRRERRRVDARPQLQAAHEAFENMGVEAFAERARRELLATGQKARERRPETRDQLTAQETQIAYLARDGLSNPEIATRLFISPRTVQYHLRKIFIKLDISSRTQLDRALPGNPDDPSAR